MTPVDGLVAFVVVAVLCASSIRRAWRERHEAEPEVERVEAWRWPPRRDRRQP